MVYITRYRFDSFRYSLHIDCTQNKKGKKRKKQKDKREGRGEKREEERERELEYRINIILKENEKWRKETMIYPSGIITAMSNLILIRKKSNFFLLYKQLSAYY